MEQSNEPFVKPQSIRVTVEIAPDGRVNVNGNAPPEMCIRVLTDGIVALSRIGFKREEKSLVMPVTGALPPVNDKAPLRRI